MSGSVKLFLCGDVMLGRGIDQILPHPGDPRLYESYAAAATAYVDLAERADGPIPKPVDYRYVWGDALKELEKARPHARIVNLETSITTSGTPAPKGINYKMNPANIGCLTAAGIDCCVLANNHVLDWREAGLLDTIESLRRAGIRSAGAGRDSAEAEAPAVVELPGNAGHAVVFAFGSTTSGIPRGWAARENRPGVNLLPDLSGRTIARIADLAKPVRRPGNLLVASIHWGGNWGYEISPDQREFAHRLIDAAGFDIVHGHSSHHAKAIEVYRGKPILYGCGDFVNDYEGIAGFEEFRGDLALMYLPCFSMPSGTPLELKLVPFRTRRFRLERAPGADAAWLRDVLGRESAKYGIRVGLNGDHTLDVRW